MLDNAQGITDLPLAFSTVPAAEEDDDSGSAAGSSHSAYAEDVTSGQAYCLYVSHSLSMWNSRMYEFAVVCIEIHGFNLQRY